MSEVASSFRRVLETCHRDLEALITASSERLSVDELVTQSKVDARDLLGALYEVTARLKDEKNVSASDIKSLEEHVRSYYDYNDAVRISRDSLQYMRYHLDEATKLFLSLKPYLTILAGERRQAVTVLSSRKVFIVHGRDQENKDALKDMLVRWGFDPIILSEQPNRGRHLLEKLLDHTSDVGFAFILMTPDDMGGTRQGFDHVVSTIAKHAYAPDWLDVVHKSFKPRVRQNVMFEYGLCIGSLGKENVCVLVGSEGLEIPSDVLGYGYLRFEKTVSECEQQIKSELEAAGYDVPKK